MAEGFTASAVVARFGPHPVVTLGIDLECAAGRRRWLMAACLYGRGIDEVTAERAVCALKASELAEPLTVDKTTPEALERVLRAAEYPTPDVAAIRVWRVSDTLARRYRGSVDALVAEADTLEELASRLAGLAPGFGAATVARYLRPLRDCWAQATEIPLQRPARAAAVHLGFLREGEDTEGEPGALRAALRRELDAPPLSDVEAALARLGARACLRNRTARCPLAEACPALRREGCYSSE